MNSSIEFYASIIAPILGLGDYTIIGDGDDKFIEFDDVVLSFSMDLSEDGTSWCHFYGNEGVTLQSVSFETFEELGQELNAIKQNGFYSEDFGITELSSLAKRVKADSGWDVNDYDDEEESIRDWESSENKASVSIVPDNIKRMRVVALKFEGVTLAYRFKTDRGSFDVRRSVALKYGVGDFKVAKMSRLSRHNGLLMSEGELKSQNLIPDVSECEEDCKKLISFLFSLN